MKLWNKKKKIKGKNKKNNNRSNLIIAIIFLFSAGIIYRLFCLQIKDHDHYIALASAQHDLNAELEPRRGKIYIQDSIVGDGTGDLYPIATNKEFAQVYAKPNQIKTEEISMVAEKLVEIFDQKHLDNQFESYYNDLKINEAKAKAEIDEIIDPAKLNETLAVDENEILAKQALKNEFVEKKKIDTLNKYLKILNKSDDPYEPIRSKVGEETVNKIKEMNIPGIAYAMSDYRFYPENNIGSHFLGFVGYSGDDKKGKYGLEGFFEDELAGKKGSIKTERDARGDWLIMNNMDYQEAVDGSDIILTINRTVQFTVCEKLKTSVMKHGADTGTVIIMDPSTGAIIAMCSYPDYNSNDYEDYYNMKIFNNPAIFTQYEPGSVFKAITMSAAVDQGKVTPSSTYKDDGTAKIQGWSKPIRNSDFETKGGHGIVDMNYVLEFSLNTGAIYAMQKIGSNNFSDYVNKFGFGEKTGIELEGESNGNINNLQVKKIKEVDAAVASFGQGISVTPLQMVNAYAAIANGGILMKPYLVKEIVHRDGTRYTTKPVQVRRVISERTSALITGMLVNVIEKGHTPRARIKGYFIAGKTGTAQEASESSRGYSAFTVHTFIGIATANDPKFVVLVKLDRPRDVKFADSSAAPLFSEIGEFLLNYYKIPAERNDEKEKKSQ